MNGLLDNYYFQPIATITTSVHGKSTAPFLSCLAKKLVNMSDDPRERQWLHQHLSLAVVRGVLPEYWLVCKFDLTLAILSVLTSVAARHLPLFNEQLLPSHCLPFLYALLSSVRFALSVSPSVQCCFAPSVLFRSLLTTAWPMMETQRCDMSHFVWNTSDQYFKNIYIFIYIYLNSFSFSSRKAWKNGNGEENSFSKPQQDLFTPAVFV